VPTSGGTVLIVGGSLEDQLDALAQLRGQLLVGVPIGILLATLVGWLVAGAALRPVERLRTEAEAISGSELGRRLAVPNTGDELARMAESLNRMLGRLEDAVERERRFVGDASHELRTPLANPKAELDLALRRSRTPDELLGALRSATEETDRLTSLAEDLLVLARTDEGRLPVRRERVDVARLVREIVASFESRASDLGIALASRSDGELAADVDATRLRQAIGNLIDNALRHVRPGGRVEIGVEEAHGVLTISVADSGDGFDAEFLAHAFEPFSRADSARSRAHGGTGLGLAIVRAVAEGHGGSVSAANGPDGGGLVEMRLPATGGALI
jgi:two-component system, OmpR family, sensor kinase